jgi:hypothetical protein
VRPTFVVLASVVAACPFASTADAGPDVDAAPPLTSTPIPESVVRSTAERLPLAFEVNRGQAPAGWDFLVRCRDYHAFVASTGIVFSFDGAALAMAVEGAERVAPTTSGEELPGKVNYFLGNDPSKWLSNVPLVRGARYADVASATSWSVGGRGRALEFSFDLAPGAAAPRLRFDGARGVRVAADGSLRVAMPTGEATISAPIAWQNEPGVGRLDVRAKFVVDKNGAVRVATWPRDPNLAVHVDPTVTYASYLGGSTSDGQYNAGAVLDASGNAYLAGATQSTGFPTTGGAYSLVKQDDGSGIRYDVFVTKINPSGSALVYSTFLGGTSDETPWGLDVDSSGAAVVLLQTASTNYPTTSGAYLTTRSGSGSIGAMTKLNSAGSSLVFSTYTGNNQEFAVTLGAAGVVWVLEGTGLSQYSANGTSLIFSRPITPTTLTACCVDSVGNAYVTGSTSSSSYATTSGTYQRTLAGGSDGFVTKISSTGVVVYATLVGGSSTDQPRSIGVNWSGQAFIAGSTSSANYPTTAGAYRSTRAASSDGFMTRLNATGTALKYSTYLGGSGTLAQAIRVHPTGACVIGGYIGDAAFPTSNPFQATYAGGYDGFVMKFNPDNSLAWSSCCGGALDDGIDRMGMGPDGSVVLEVYTTSTDLPTTNPYQTANAGSNDAFFLKIADTLPTTLVPPSVTATSLNASTVGAPYSKQFASTGGYGAVAWTVVSGALPAGLTLSGTGLLSGTLAQGGTFTFTLHAEDPIEQFGERQFSVTVNPPPTVSATTFPTSTVGLVYDRTISATGGTGTLTLSITQGAAPPGTEFGADGRVTGTLTTAGDYAFTVTATDAFGISGSRAFAVHVNPVPAMTWPALPDWTEFRPYVPAQFGASGGTAPLAWSVSSGSTPTTFDVATGRLIGLTKAAGAYSFKMRLTDTLGAFVERSFNVVINPTPEIEPFTLPLGAVGRPYSGGALAVAGGTPPFTWFVESGELPPGVSLDATTGAVVGAITAPTDLTVTFACADASGAIARTSVFARAGSIIDLTKKKLVEKATFDVSKSSIVRYMELTEGAVLGITLTGGANGTHLPTIALADGASAPIDVAQWIKSTPKVTTLKGYVVPATGRYFVTIVVGDGFQGDVKLQVTVAPKSVWTSHAAVAPTAPAEYEFSAPPGALVTITAKASKGGLALPHVASIVAPDGSDLVGVGKLVESRGSAKFTSKTPLDGGSYRVVFAARDAGVGDVAWTVKLKLPKLYTFALTDLPAGE